MGLDFELDEKSGDQPDKKTSYVSLSRQNSNVQDKMSTSLGFRDHCSPSIVKLSQNGKEGREVNLIMSDGEPEAEDFHKSGDSDRRLPNSEAIGSKLKEELCKYKQELKEYNETTKDLEEKYMKINYELSEMQQKHDHFVSSRAQTSEMDMGSEADPGSFYSSASSVASKMTIRRKSPEILRSNTSFMTVLSAQSSCDDISRKKYPSERGNHQTKHCTCFDESVVRLFHHLALDGETVLIGHIGDVIAQRFDLLLGGIEAVGEGIQLTLHLSDHSLPIIDRQRGRCSALGQLLLQPIDLLLLLGLDQLSPFLGAGYNLGGFGTQGVQIVLCGFELFAEEIPLSKELLQFVPGLGQFHLALG